MKIFKQIVFILIAVLMPPTIYAQTTESMQITTYFPAPNMAASRARLVPLTGAPVTCSSTTLGTMYYLDSSPDVLTICIDSGSGPSWAPVGTGASSSLWSVNLSPTPTLYPSTTTRNIGIHTSDAPRPLQIGGTTMGIGLEEGTSSPDSGFMRFGDNTGWRFHITRSSECPACVLNTGNTGAVVTVRDNNPPSVPNAIVGAGAVGINTRDPQAHLDVNGAIRQSGFGAVFQGEIILGRQDWAGDAYEGCDTATNNCRALVADNWSDVDGDTVAEGLLQINYDPPGPATADFREGTQINGRVTMPDTLTIGSPSPLLGATLNISNTSPRIDLQDTDALGGTFLNRFLMTTSASSDPLNNYMNLNFLSLDATPTFIKNPIGITARGPGITDDIYLNGNVTISNALNLNTNQLNLGTSFLPTTTWTGPGYGTLEGTWNLDCAAGTVMNGIEIRRWREGSGDVDMYQFRIRCN